MATDLPILFQDEHILVINKPAGIPVHPGYGDHADTVTTLLKDQLPQDDSVRPGVVHRLDKDTSGVLVLARTKAAETSLKSQFKQRKVSKTYIAAVRGHLKHPKANIDVPIGRHPKNPLKRAARSNGKPAFTTYEVIDEKPAASLLRLHPLTGRTHQLRVHLSYIGHPILGDKLYGQPYQGLSRHFLHAQKLEIAHPHTNKKATFESDLPSDLKQVWYNEA